MSMIPTAMTTSRLIPGMNKSRRAIKKETQRHLRITDVIPTVEATMYAIAEMVTNINRANPSILIQYTNDMN